MTRTGTALLVGGLLVLAGCSVVDDPADRGPTSTLTPAPVPEAADAATTSQRPGALRQPLDPWDVADAHAATLAGQNYTWVLSRNRTTHRPGPLRSRATVRSVRVANRTTYRVDRTRRGTSWSGYTRAGTEPTEYATGGQVFERRPADGPARARPLAQPRGREGPVGDRAEAVVARYLAANRTTVEPATTEGAAYVIRGNGAPPAVAAATAESVASYRVTALVESDGRVRAMTARWRDGTRAIVTVRMRYRAVGETTVTPPSWFTGDDGRAAAGNGTAGATGEWVGWPAWASDD